MNNEAGDAGSQARIASQMRRGPQCSVRAAAAGSDSRTWTCCSIMMQYNTQPFGEQIALPSDLITLSKGTRSAIHTSFGTFGAAAGRLSKRVMSEH